MSSRQDQPDYLSGDPVAFGSLISRYQGALFGFLGRMGFDQSTAEDLAQETFLRAWKNRHSFDPSKAQVSTWLFTIARNHALNQLSRKSRVVSADVGTDTQLEPAGRDSPSDQYEQHQSVVRLREALNSLSLADREVLAVCYTPEISTDNKVLQCSEGKMRTRLSRARKRLKAALSELE